MVCGLHKILQSLAGINGAALGLFNLLEAKKSKETGHNCSLSSAKFLIQAFLYGTAADDY